MLKVWLYILRANIDIVYALKKIKKSADLAMQTARAFSSYAY